ncbi:MAG: SDR family oxidoreductase [Candidatus Manganitrophaceae bacterium]|nr:MAG: SDR family oxidoreductase [Candidatus Manganitrophaceae bacterium]
MKLKGKTVLVTGAGRRVGRSIALALAERGARVSVHYNRSKKEAQAVVKEIEKRGGTAHSVQGDLAKARDCARIVQQTVKVLGRLDVLVNNAAVFFKTPLSEVTEKDWDLTLDSNLKGSFFCAQAAAKAMQQEGGKIINFADWSGFRPYVDYLPYCISKAGVIAMTKGLAKTLAPKIEVNAVAPGPILLPEDLDPMEKEEVERNTPLKKVGSPQDIVNAILFLIEGTDFMTGATIVIDGGRLIA